MSLLYPAEVYDSARGNNCSKRGTCTKQARSRTFRRRRQQQCYNHCPLTRNTPRVSRSRDRGHAQHNKLSLTVFSTCICRDLTDVQPVMRLHSVYDSILGGFSAIHQTHRQCSLPVSTCRHARLAKSVALASGTGRGLSACGGVHRLVSALHRVRADTCKYAERLWVDSFAPTIPAGAHGVSVSVQQCIDVYQRGCTTWRP
ncbi:unnamed protein product [Rangifer tarandus platyrhynchus]|uniref:Uncharacterized protein n=1 Tax=Rangifer tarandus platyrhynchus TaxID=3082113 RepID=A0ABN8XJJ1_RANTA|nr:unnamed protein product [Rangifer tarandus platyrhynchus]